MRCLAALLLALPLLPVQAGDWPQWRGPDRNGISAETGWLHQWGSSGPHLQWKAKVGLGFSSFVVADGRAYTAGYADDKDTLFCFEANTGKVLWQHSYPSELGDKYFDGGTTGTPTLDVAGGRLYWLSRWGDVLCLNTADGKVVWQRNVAKETQTAEPTWGFTGAPLLLDGRLILNVGDAGLALDPKTGATLWKSPTKSAGYSTPLPFRQGPDTLVALGSAQAYVAVHPKDGREAWRIRWVTEYGVNAADPIVHDGRIFLSSGYGKGAGLFQLPAAAGAEPASAWRSKILRTQMNPAVLHEGHLYGVDGNTTDKASLKCIEFATGKEKWTHPNFGSGGVILAGTRLLALSGTGELLTAPATPAGFQPTARAQVLGGKCWTAPVLAHGLVFCRNSRGDVTVLNLGQAAQSRGN
jgi:outer membrane protein assembly factor BamB